MGNGEYSSIEHRAIVNFEKERLSIAAFHSPGLNDTHSCRYSLRSLQVPCLYLSLFAIDNYGLTSLTIYK
ncbi:putative (S)-norcoclaurine synthase [Helianthus anomalus]